MMRELANSADFMSDEWIPKRTRKPLPPPGPICLARYSRCPITGDIVPIVHDLDRHGL
jgi:hypothetical protein